MWRRAAPHPDADARRDAWYCRGMSQGRRLVGWVTFAFVAGCGARHEPVAPAPKVVLAPEKPVEATEPGLFPLPAWDADAGRGTGATWSMLDGLVKAKSVVLLGESLHVTTEFPRVRLPILRRLHEQLHFDVVAVEGSMVDAWLAQDDLLRAPKMDAAAVEEASRTGWLTLWNTAAMREVLDYVARTGGRERLYFASMDIQPGMGGTPIKKAVMRRFIERVLEYAGEPDAGATAEKLSATLDPLRTCGGEQPAPPERVDAVAKVVRAIRGADPKVRAVLPMHADALALVPTMLDERLHHCSEILGPGGKFAPNEYWRNYKEARDRYQAANVVALRDKVSRSHRVVVWGHHSHLGYRAAGARASVSISGVLRDRLPGETYALGLFAGAGSYLRVQDGPRDNISRVDVSAPGDPCCRGLDALRGLSSSPTGYLLDLALAQGNPRVSFAKERLGYPLEGDGVPAVLADEFDGVLFVPRISAATLE